MAACRLDFPAFVSHKCSQVTTLTHVTVRTRLVLATLGALSFALGGLVVAPATATMTTLCTTYSGCAQQGYSNAGYAKNSGTMYWRMYSGHNCTNYAAYRMVSSGLPNVRPWTGGGNATYWGTSMSRITDFETADIRFPTSLSLDGSDAMNPDPDYSAAYV